MDDIEELRLKLMRLSEEVKRRQDREIELAAFLKENDLDANLAMVSEDNALKEALEFLLLSPEAQNKLSKAIIKGSFGVDLLG
tara:strand:- start:342 stop:590 length:249 start_codon:yes stop_codon:yes gene_type:complete